MDYSAIRGFNCHPSFGRDALDIWRNFDRHIGLGVRRRVDRRVEFGVWRGVRPGVVRHHVELYVAPAGQLRIVRGVDGDVGPRIRAPVGHRVDRAIRAATIRDCGPIRRTVRGDGVDASVLRHVPSRVRAQVGCLLHRVEGAIAPGVRGQIDGGVGVVGLGVRRSGLSRPALG